MNTAGFTLLEEFESFVGHAYPDPYSPLGKALQAQRRWHAYLRAPFELTPELKALSGAPWTIGFGFTDGVKEGDTITLDAARARLAFEVQGYEDEVKEACTVAPTENELAAMVCLAWNIGLGWEGAVKPKGAKDGFKQSSVLRAHNKGDHLAASRAFGLWNRASGEESAGLTRRRAAEAALYLKPGEFEDTPDMPQVVEAESPMIKSPVVVATTALTATSVLDDIAPVISDLDLSWVVHLSKQVGEIRAGLGLGDMGEIAGLLQMLGITHLMPHLFLGSIVCLGSYIIWQRVKQRVKGWA